MKRMTFLPINAIKYFSRYYSSSLPSPSQDAVKVLGKEVRQIHLKHVDLIHQFIGGSPERIKSALSSHIRLQLLDEKVIEEKLCIIQDMMLDDQDTLRIIPLLNYHSIVLKNRYKLLLEYGIIPHKICTAHVRRCFSICRSSVHKLKDKHLIKKDFNVLRNLWKIAGLNMNTCPVVPETSTLHELKIIAVKEFLKEKIDFPDNLYGVYEKEIMFRMKNKSFETILRNLHIYRDILELSNTRLAHNFFTFYNEPERTLELLYKVKSVAGIDMKTILHVYPKISSMSAENMEKIMEYLEAENIPVKFTHRCLEIFTLNCETVRQRLKEIKEEEFFRLNIKNPQIIRIIHFLVKAKKRFAILQSLRLNPTLACISGNEESFERYIEDGSRPFSSDTIHYIDAELGLPKYEFSKKIKVHHRWNYVPLIHVGRNLQNLRNHFTDDEIREYVYVLFYYSERLINELELIHNREGLEEFKEEGKIKQEYILPLVLYFLEKESNFTGESIWNPDDSNPYQDLPDLPEGIQKR